jgi:hypothetical protein
VSFYVWYRCQEKGCRKVFRNRRLKEGVKALCPHCSSPNTKLFGGDVTKALPPCSPELSGHSRYPVKGEDDGPQAA